MAWFINTRPASCSVDPVTGVRAAALFPEEQLGDRMTNQVYFHHKINHWKLKRHLHILSFCGMFLFIHWCLLNCLRVSFTNISQCVHKYLSICSPVSFNSLHVYNHESYIGHRYPWICSPVSWIWSQVSFNLFTSIPQLVFDIFLVSLNLFTACTKFCTYLSPITLNLVTDIFQFVHRCLSICFYESVLYSCNLREKEWTNWRYQWTNWEILVYLSIYLFI